MSSEQRSESQGDERIEEMDVQDLPDISEDEETESDQEQSEQQQDELSDGGVVSDEKVFDDKNVLMDIELIMKARAILTDDYMDKLNEAGVRETLELIKMLRIDANVDMHVKLAYMCEQPIAVCMFVQERFSTFGKMCIKRHQVMFEATIDLDDILKAQESIKVAVENKGGKEFQEKLMKNMRKRQVEVEMEWYGNEILEMGKQKIDDVAEEMKENLRELTREIVESKTEHLVEDKLGNFVETATNVVEGIIPGHVERAIEKLQCKINTHINKSVSEKHERLRVSRRRVSIREDAPYRTMSR